MVAGRWLHYIVSAIPSLAIPTGKQAIAINTSLLLVPPNFGWQPYLKFTLPLSNEDSVTKDLTILIADS